MASVVSFFLLCPNTSRWLCFLFSFCKRSGEWERERGRVFFIRVLAVDGRRKEHRTISCYFVSIAPWRVVKSFLPFKLITLLWTHTHTLAFMRVLCCVSTRSRVVWTAVAILLCADSSSTAILAVFLSFFHWSLSVMKT